MELSGKKQCKDYWERRAANQAMRKALDHTRNTSRTKYDLSGNQHTDRNREKEEDAFPRGLRVEIRLPF